MGWRHLRRNGIAAPQQQIERLRNAQSHYNSVKDNKNYILKYLLCFHIGQPRYIEVKISILSKITKSDS